MNRLRVLAVAAAMVAATVIPAWGASAAVDRVCIRSGSAAASQIFAYYSTGGYSIIRPGQCSSSSLTLTRFKIGGIACYSPWGTLYRPYSEHSAAAIVGDLNFTCR